MPPNRLFSYIHTASVLFSAGFWRCPDWCADARVHIRDEAVMYTVLGAWPPEALGPSGGRLRKLVYRRRLYLPNSGQIARTAAPNAAVIILIVFEQSWKEKKSAAPKTRTSTPRL